MDWELKDSFDIDHGELDGFDLKHAFTFGVQWGIVHAKLQQREPFRLLFHTANEVRIRRLCERSGRAFHIRPHDDWPELIVD